MSAAETGQIAVGWMSRQVDVWDLKQVPLNTPQRRFDGHAVGVYVVRHLDRGSNIVVGDPDGTVAIWNVGRAEKAEASVRVNAPSDQNQVCAIGVSDDDRLLAIGVGGTRAGSAHVWDRQTKRWIYQQDGYAGSVFTAFGRDGELIVASQESRRADPSGGIQTVYPWESRRSTPRKEQPDVGWPGLMGA